MQNVGIRKDGEWLLKGVNWNIQKGEHWVLFGLNGAGKTTLLNVMNAYIFPMEGTVSVLGMEFGKTYLREKLRKNIGFVSESLKLQFQPSETAAEVMLSGLFGSIGLYDKPTEEQIDKVISMLKLLGCYEYRNRRFETLSQGERQRVLIGRALMADPQMLILDEPTSGLDFLAREQLLDAVDKIASTPNGPSIIYVTHHVEEVLPQFTKTILLKKGQVYATGETKDLLSSETLSNFLEMDVEVVWHNKRPFLSSRQLVE